jgi:hypothetical protein
LNPRKEWYAKIHSIETPDPYTVIFRLRRPQPSLLMMLASGYSPIYPAHVPLASIRAKCVGTGPFRFKAKPILGWRFGYFVQWPYVKNLVPHHVIYNYARMQEVWLDT